MTRLNLSTSELRQGDVVFCHGMLCLIDRPVQVSQSHADQPGVGDGKTRFTQALVLNRDDPATAAVPFGWTRDWDGPAHRAAANGEHRWTIQGNDLARWHVEREEVAAEGWYCPDCEQPSRRFDPVWIAKHRRLEGRV